MISIELQACSVELLHVDPWEDIVRTSWQDSTASTASDENTAVDLCEILKLDTSVGELAGVVLNLTVPLLIKEVIASMRDLTVWAHTSRAGDLENVWPIHESVDSADLIGIKALAKKLEGEAKEGSSKDDLRQNLPLSYMTTFTSRFSIRSLVGLIRYFDYLNMHDQCGVMLGKVLNELSDKLSDVLIGIGVEVGRLLEVLRAQDLCPEFSPGSSLVARGGTENYIVVALQAPLALRAQIVEHRVLQLSDDLIEVMRHPMVWTLPLHHKVCMEISSTYAGWKSVIAKWNCWLAQSDLWKPVIDLVNAQIGIGRLVLPCTDEVCPFEEECTRRLQNEATGVPCPRHLRLSPHDTQGLFKKHKVSLNAYEVDVRDHVEASSKLKDYWLHELGQTRVYLELG